MFSFRPRWFVAITLWAVLMQAQARTFTDKFGREIEADLVSYGDGKIELKRGGKTFKVPVETFSDADQAYIKQWAEENPAKVSYRFRTVMALKESRSGRTASAGTMVDDKLKHRPHHYNVLVSNMSKSDATDVEVRFEIYVNDVVDMTDGRYASLAVGAKKKDKLQVIPGKLAKTTIPADGKIEFDSDFEIQDYVDRDGGRVDQAASDKVIGIRIRVYKDGAMIHEYADAEDDGRMRSAAWSDAAASKDTPVR